MKKNFTITCISLSLLTSAGFAQAPVWSTDIAPILFNNCASCHRQGGIGPFELTTYNNAVTNAANIEAAVSSRYMPPWPPEPKYNRLAHERLLSNADIRKIKDWVSGGKLQGDPNLAPPLPAFNANGDLPGTPDMVTPIPTFTSTATTGDVYQCFVVPSGLSTDKYISAFEAIPGDRNIVHHVLVYADTTGTCAGLDAAEAGPGYVSFGGVGTDAAMLLGGWVPGTLPMEFPDSFGVRIPKNADIVIQIHYPKGSVGKVDSTKIKFYFSKLPSTQLRPVRIDPVLNHGGDVFCTLSPGGTLIIPANQTKKYVESSPVSALVGDISLLGIAPHMHLIGRSINAYGVKGTDTLKLINIPSWDFSWQGFYMFRKLIKLPAGTDLYSEAFYDNTTSNPFNPSNPPQLVTAGEATTDEMMLTFFIWAYYQPGDEYKVIDPSTPVDLSVSSPTAYDKFELFTPYPNPSTGQLFAKFYMKQPATISIQVTDLQGRTVKQVVDSKPMSAGYHVQPADISTLPSGNYLLQMNTGAGTLTQKITIQH